MYYTIWQRLLRVVIEPNVIWAKREVIIYCKMRWSPYLLHNIVVYSIFQWFYCSGFCIKVAAKSHYKRSGRCKNVENSMAADVSPRQKGKGSPYSITERMVPELIPVLGSQSADDVSHKPGGRLSLLSARPAVTLATLKRAASSFAAW